ncbi:hypothetical protein BD779DRAFT_1388322, partial [Infundibulicybe gibba]
PIWEERLFPPFSSVELDEALRPTSNSSAPGPDHVSWRILKLALGKGKKERVMTVMALIRLFDACVLHGVFPDYFKETFSVIIPKPKKPDYALLKAYRPIALLNTLGKLLEKLIANRIQF